MSPHGMAHELFAGVPWSRYLNEMSRDDAYGDEITLRAIANVYGVHIRIVSTFEQDAMTGMAPTSCCKSRAITVGHCDENNDIHYVVLGQQGEVSECSRIC